MKSDEGVSQTFIQFVLNAEWLFWKNFGIGTRYVGSSGRRFSEDDELLTHYTGVSHWFVTLNWEPIHFLECTY